MATKRVTCQECVCCSSLRIRFDLCERLRATGACAIQNSQRVVVVVARPETLAELLDPGTALTIPARFERGWSEGTET